jgi:ankyrin repeat protein
MKLFAKIAPTAVGGGLAAVLAGALTILPAVAQTAPSAAEIAAYGGLFKAAASGEVADARALITGGADLSTRDGNGRTPLHVAAFASHDAMVTTLIDAGADPNLLDADRYDIITIAAVANDTDIVKLALSLGGKADNVTSIYDGTALIAAAHLGNVGPVLALIGAGAPLDHVNNLGWTALIEAVILGDGGPRHLEIVRALIAAGADASLADSSGVTPLDHARARGYAQMVAALRAYLLYTE